MTPRIRLPDPSPQPLPRGEGLAAGAYAILLAISHIHASMTGMRLVLDTSTMVTAIRNSAGASGRLLTAALERRLTLVASVPLVIEYEAVMTRPEHLEASGLTKLQVSNLLDAVTAVAEEVRLAFLWRPTLPDPDDDMVLETAVNGRAGVIATFNISDFRGVAPQFGVEILAPRDALWRLENRK